MAGKIPNDPIMCLSFVNTQLRDFYPDLDELCSAFDTELTDEHKKDVLEQRMSDAVTDTYADYMSQLSSKENQDVWSEVIVDTSLKLESASFMK